MRSLFHAGCLPCNTPRSVLYFLTGVIAPLTQIPDRVFFTIGTPQLSGLVHHRTKAFAGLLNTTSRALRSVVFRMARFGMEAVLNPLDHHPSIHPIGRKVHTLSRKPPKVAANMT